MLKRLLFGLGVGYIMRRMSGGRRSGYGRRW
jgi:hypothetical protein